MSLRRFVLTFGAVNFASSLTIHFLCEPAWPVVLSFGLMGVVLSGCGTVRSRETDYLGEVSLWFVFVVCVAHET